MDTNSNIRDGSAQSCAEIKLEIDCDGGETRTLECSSVFDGKVIQTLTKNVERVRDEMKQGQESSQNCQDSETVRNNGTGMPDLMTGIKQEPEDGADWNIKREPSEMEENKKADYKISCGIIRAECCNNVPTQVVSLDNNLMLREKVEEPGFYERDEESTVELEMHVKSENISEFVKHDVSFMEFTPELMQNIKNETKNKTGNVCCTGTEGSDKYVTEQRLNEVGELVNVKCDQTVTENNNVSQCSNIGTLCKTNGENQPENMDSFSRKNIQHTLKKSNAADVQTCDNSFVVHKQHICEFCNAQFAEISLLHTHLQEIHNQITSEIKQDNYDISGECTLHKITYAKEKNYKCDVCGVNFKRSGHLNYHKRIHTGEKRYKCDVCGVNFTHNGQLNDHKWIHTGEKPYKCDLCDGSFARKYVLNRHKRIHTREKPYKCDICCVNFTRNGQLNRHKRIHAGEKPYICDICGKSFAHSDHLIRHKRIHTGEKPYMCDVCGINFTCSSSLNSHKRTHTGEKPYKCDVCCVNFTHNGQLNRHKRIHTGEKPYKCDVCCVNFTHKGQLNRHKRIHTGEKPYICDACGIDFTDSLQLRRHKRTHTGEKPYKCNVCCVNFTHNEQLNRHKRIHTGEKPYKCDICGGSFAHSGYLSRHKRIHTGEKLYKCDVCGINFTYSGSLKVHKRTHTGEKPYKCDICGDNFVLNIYLKRHKKTHT